MSKQQRVEQVHLLFNRLPTPQYLRSDVRGEQFVRVCALERINGTLVLNKSYCKGQELPKSSGYIKLQ